MEKRGPTRLKLLEENRNLRERLWETEQTIEAIQSGEVDALVVYKPDGERLYTLTGADHGYRILVESIIEGALILSSDDAIYYCNSALGEILQLPIQKIIGARLGSYVAFSEGRALLSELINESRGLGTAKGELLLKRNDGTILPVSVSLNRMSFENFEGVCGVITDLSEQKRVEIELQRHRTELELLVDERTADLAETNSELLTYQAELETQNEELRRARDDLDISRARYADLYDFAPIGYLTLNSNGQIIDLNLTAARQLGIERGHLINRFFLNSVFQPDRKEFLLHLRNLFRRRGRQICELRLSPKGGGQFHARLESIYTEGEDGEGLCRTAMSDVTVRKQAELLLQRQAELLHLSYDAVIVSRLGGGIESWNRGAEELYGYSLEEAVGRVTQDLLKTIQPEPWPRIAVKLREQKFWEGELKHRTRDGREVIVSARYQLVRSADGIERVLETNRDITDRKRAEEALRESEDRFRSLVRLSPVPAALVGPHGVIRFLNDRFMELLGYTLDDIPNIDDWWRLAYPDRDYRQQVMEGWDAVLDETARSGGFVESAEFNVMCKDGTTRVLEVSPIHVGDSILASFIDLTEHKRLELALRKSRDDLEQRVRERTAELISANQSLQNRADLLDLAHDAVLVRDIDGAVTFWNEGAAEIYGFTRREALGKTLHGLVHTEYPMPSDELEKLVIGTGRWEGELRQTTASGNTIVVESRWALNVDKDGNTLGFLEVNRDITSRKLAEIEVRNERQRFYNVLEALPVSIALIDREHRVPFANKAFREFFGEPSERPCHELKFRNPSPCDFCQAFKVFETNELQHWERIAANGRNVDIYDIPFADIDGSPLILALDIDITERRQAEAQLRTTIAKLEELNQELQEFAFVASHDLQEPLRKIQAFGNILLGKHKDSLDAQGRDYMDRAIKAANRMSELLRALLNYSRTGTSQLSRQPISLTEVVRDAAGDLEHRIDGAGGKVAVGELPAVEGDAVLLRQLFQNLIENAIKYRKESEPPIVNIYGSVSGSICRISIEDNGIGFDERYCQKIFRPFERLHGKSSPYSGTGMGLAICRKIVTRHGGDITVRSVPGQGTTFTVSLPLKQRAGA